MKRRLFVTSLIVLSFVATACDPGELGAFLSELATSDFSLSSDPEVQAAGATPGVNDAEAVARRARDDAVAAKDSSLVDLEARPKDPRNMMTKAVLEINEGRESAKDTVQRAKGLVEEANPDDPPRVQDRKARELYLDTINDLIKSDPDFPNREGLIGLYCFNIAGYIVSQDANSPEVQQYLLFADLSLCPRG